MTTNKVFSINQIDDNTIQIYGLINGFARKRPWPGEMAGSYGFSIKFFDQEKRLIKISNNAKDGTVRSVKRLVERISDIYAREFASTQSSALPSA